MPRMIFVSLPVRDLDRAVAFYKAVGAEQDPQFSGGGGAMMRFSDAIHVMLATHEKIAELTTKRIADPRESTSVLLALSCDSREEVDAMTLSALAAGGREVHGAEDHGWMYSRAFEDPDGHGWGPLWMDPEAAAQAMAATAEAAAHA